MSNSFSRYQQVLQSIPCAPDSISTTELLEILVNKELIKDELNHRSKMRTIQRVLDNICLDHDCIEKLDETRPHRYRVQHGQLHPVNPSAMSSVVSLQMIEHEILNMLPPSMHQEVSTLISTANVESDNRQRLWQQRFAYAPVEFQLLPPEINNEHIKTIERAILDKLTLKMRYRKRGAANGESYTVTPLGITLHGNSFYLLAKRNDINEHRTFAIHRIESLKISFSATNYDHEFETRSWIEENWNFFSGGKMIDVKLRVENYSGEHIIKETKISPCQSVIEDKDGYSVITAKARDCHGFEWWLLKNIDIVEVLAPVDLRQRMLKRIRAAQGLYGET